MPSTIPRCVSFHSHHVVCMPILSIRSPQAASRRRSLRTSTQEGACRVPAEPAGRGAARAAAPNHHAACTGRRRPPGAVGRDRRPTRRSVTQPTTRQPTSRQHTTRQPTTHRPATVRPPPTLCPGHQRALPHRHQRLADTRILQGRPSSATRLTCRCTRPTRPAAAALCRRFVQCRRRRCCRPPCRPRGKRGSPRRTPPPHCRPRAMVAKVRTPRFPPVAQRRAGQPRGAPVAQGMGRCRLWRGCSPRTPHPAAQRASWVRQDHAGTRPGAAVWLPHDGGQRVGRPQRDGTAGVIAMPCVCTTC